MMRLDDLELLAALEREDGMLDRALHDVLVQGQRERERDRRAVERGRAAAEQRARQRDRVA